MLHAVFYGVIDVFARVGLQEFPDFAVRVERLWITSFYLIEQVRDDAVFTDIVRNILFGIISTHGCPVVDVFFKYVTDYIRVYVLPCGGNACVQVPFVLVKEAEYLLKGLIWYFGVFIFMLYMVHIKQAAVEVRHNADFFGNFWSSFT